MSFLLAGIALTAGASTAVAVGAGVVGASTAYGAYKGAQQEKAYGEAETAAGGIRQQKLDLLFNS